MLQLHVVGFHLAGQRLEALVVIGSRFQASAQAHGSVPGPLQKPRPGPGGGGKLEPGGAHACLM